jgi:uncharacterized protein (DUF1697 family)
MKRYAALLRGVSPINLKMPALKTCFEEMGFTDVKTVLASGNVVFSGRAMKEATLEKKCEAALLEATGKEFMTLVRSVEHLRELIEEDPYSQFRLPAQAKRVVTFLREAPKSRPKLPIEKDGARILALRGHEALSAYVVSSKGPVFMTLIEKTFGKEVTTRTWDTVKKLAK